MIKENYTTQMDAAKKGIITKELKTVAQKEHFEIPGNPGSFIDQHGHLGFFGFVFVLDKGDRR